MNPFEDPVKDSPDSASPLDTVEGLANIMAEALGEDYRPEGEKKSTVDDLPDDATDPEIYVQPLECLGDLDSESAQLSFFTMDHPSHVPPGDSLSVKDALMYMMFHQEGLAMLGSYMYGVMVEDEGVKPEDLPESGGFISDHYILDKVARTGSVIIHDKNFDSAKMHERAMAAIPASDHARLKVQTVPLGPDDKTVGDVLRITRTLILEAGGQLKDRPNMEDPS